MAKKWQHERMGRYDTYPEGVIDQDAFAKVLEKRGAHEVTPMEAYTEIFHLGDHLIQRKGEYSDKTHPIKGNPIGYYKNNDEQHGHFHIMLEDTFEDDLKLLQSADFAVLSGLSYIGRRNTGANQSKCYALIFDIDGILDVTAGRIFDFASAGAMPLPQYIALSGHGFHLYYVFDEPLSLYPNVKVQLKDLKYFLTDIFWVDKLSVDEHIQYQGLNQGFRVFGGRTKIPGKKVRVFEVNPHPTTIQELNDFDVSGKHHVDCKKIYDTHTPLAEAAEKWPEWHQRRVVEGRPRGHYKTSPAVYRWWLKKIQEPGVVALHHRYFCIMVLYIFAIKCGIPKSRVDKDAVELVPYFDSISVEYPFTVDDVRSAAECYDARFCTFPRKDLSKLSGVPMGVQKRSKRDQATHLKIARFTRDLEYPDGSWINKDGRPKGSGTKKDLVEAYAKSHPDATPTQAARDLGISRPTVYKWWPKSVTVTR